MNMNMEKKTYSQTNSDRLSNLPQSIKIHILSFLSTRDAVRTSVLSNSWRALWTELPTLKSGKYDLYNFARLEDLPCDDKNDTANLKRESILKRRERYYAFLDQALGSMSKLENINLYMPNYGLELKSRLDYWLGCVVGCRVKVLKLMIDGREDVRYSLPKSVLRVNSITKLELQGCELNSGSLIDTELPSLVKLSLQCVNLDEGVMEKLPAFVPNLEVFIFNRCNGLTRLEFFGLTKLVKVDVELNTDDIQEIEIGLPNLVEFVFMNEYDSFNDFRSCNIEVAECKNMKRLKLVCYQLDDDDLNMLLEGLPVLEELVLYECNALRNICISCQHLVRLEFQHCRDLYTVELDTPNLKFFDYTDNDLICFVPKGPILKLIEVYFYLKPGCKGDKWYLNLVKVFAKLSNCERFTVCIGLEEDLMVPEKVRMKYKPPLRGIKDLRVSLRASHLKYTPVRFIEALLWLAPRPESISIYNNYVPVLKVLKFTYEKPLKGVKKCGCWRSPPIHCWRHALEKVSLENQEGDEDDKKLATFFCKARYDGKKVHFVKKAGPVTKQRSLSPYSCSSMF